ncbi:hypothetical protein DFJ73DRAFT_450300 [Zopfochytrium polystomum]|nr:hypothetical protein DFJ73DRAFT_450300 [Zopfochytrium polystomum]
MLDLRTVLFYAGAAAATLTTLVASGPSSASAVALPRADGGDYYVAPPPASTSGAAGPSTTPTSTKKKCKPKSTPTDYYAADSDLSGKLGGALAVDGYNGDSTTPSSSSSDAPEATPTPSASYDETTTNDLVDTSNSGSDTGSDSGSNAGSDSGSSAPATSSPASSAPAVDYSYLAASATPPAPVAVTWDKATYNNTNICKSCGYAAPSTATPADAHNSLRQLYGLQLLQWDESLAAASYAKVAAGGCSGSSAADDSNENTAWAADSTAYYGTPSPYTGNAIVGAINQWHSEAANYFRVSKGGVDTSFWKTFTSYGYTWDDIGHFTAMMWSSLDKVGCASLICNEYGGSADKYYVSCHYGDSSGKNTLNLYGQLPF